MTDAEADFKRQAVKAVADAMYQDRWAGDATEGQFAGERYDDAEQQAAVAVDAMLTLIRQLESSAGEGFTHAQAVYGVNKAGL